MLYNVRVDFSEGSTSFLHWRGTISSRVEFSFFAVYLFVIHLSCPLLFHNFPNSIFSFRIQISVRIPPPPFFLILHTFKGVFSCTFELQGSVPIPLIIPKTLLGQSSQVRLLHSAFLSLHYNGGKK